MVTEIILGFLAAIAILTRFGGFRIINQVERGIVFRFGRAQKEIRRPGVTFLIRWWTG